VSGPTPRRLWAYVGRHLGLRGYLRQPGDGRQRPQIPAATLVWALLIGQVLREWSYHGVEALVRSRARGALRVSRRFGDDALGYFTARLDPAPTRGALAAVVRQAKRNKALSAGGLIGLAIDGTGAGHCQNQAEHCALCHPLQAGGYLHHFELISVVGVGLSLPFDIEPYGPGDCEYVAGQRLLRRAIAQVGRRFADYVVADGEFATAPFLHVAGELGLRVVARLKGNLPELFAAAQARFSAQPPALTIEDGGERIELWDAADFDPWQALRWPTVRVLRYRQHKADGTVVEAYWLTDFPPAQVGSRTLYRLAKSRWEIENQGFNDGKTRHGMEHISHHDANSLLIGWLLTVFALTIERLYRLRYLHRGRHRPLPASEFVLRLRLSLGRTRPHDDTS
jgi:hypothetical protein